MIHSIRRAFKDGKKIEPPIWVVVCCTAHFEDDGHVPCYTAIASFSADDIGSLAFERAAALASYLNGGRGFPFPGHGDLV